VKTARILRGLMAVAWVLAAAAAYGQRPQFASQLAPADAPATVYGGTSGTGVGPTMTAPSPAAGGLSPAPTFSPPAAPSAAAPPLSMPPPVSGAPLGGGYGGAPIGPGYGSPGAAATLDGTIQPPPAAYDPYAVPGSQPTTLCPQDPYLSGGMPTFATATKFIKAKRIEYSWIPAGSGDKAVGITDTDTNVTFQIPFFFNTQTPLLITPGFGFHFWSGPQSLPPLPLADLPGVTYDAYLDTAWNPQVNEWFSGELSFRIGVYSDFKQVVARSLRYTGTGYAVLKFSPSFVIKAGIIYYDRVDLKLLPAGGFIWTPNPDYRFEILFPNPKISKRMFDYGNTQWWGYLAGYYPNGGAWTVTRADFVDPGIRDGVDFVDYTDIRTAVGMDFKHLGGVTGFFEVGVAFERQIHYRSDLPEVFYPSTNVYLRAGVAF
jgi:hypothetical protein